ncbi:MAG: hydrogenase formation protein HypD [Arcobacteraceae bacterium]
MANLQLKDLYDGFRNSDVIKALALSIENEALKLSKDLKIMEVCGGHTHAIMKYGLNQLLPKNIKFIHGPGCPVCVMPKNRIDHAIALANMKDTIIVTLGDMIKVLGSYGTLQDARAKGADVRFVYSPMDAVKIASENPDKTVIYIAIGFETTTPMTSALVDTVIKQNIKNLFFHINHVLVPPAMRALLDDKTNNIDAFIGPSHVSVISGSKIYDEFADVYKKPVVVSGFEPVDVMQSVLMLVKQINEGRSEIEIQYSRCVNHDGNINAQKLNDKYLEVRESFEFRGLGEIPSGGLKLKDEFAFLDAEVIYKDILPHNKCADHKLCLCGEILKGKALPNECKLFGKACTPTTPIGSCMVSSEGACAAYYKYGISN